MTAADIAIVLTGKEAKAVIGLEHSHKQDNGKGYRVWLGEKCYQSEIVELKDNDQMTGRFEISRCDYDKYGECQVLLLCD